MCKILLQVTPLFNAFYQIYKGSGDLGGVWFCNQSSKVFAESGGADFFGYDFAFTIQEIKGWIREGVVGAA